MRMLTVGRPKDKSLVSLIQDYQTRLQVWGPLPWDVVPEVPYRANQETYARRAESDALLAKISPKEFVVLLDIDGDMVNSVELSRRIIRWQDQAQNLVFVIGGSLGVEDGVIQRAGWRWSLSRLTLPHALAQLVTIEQIYRALAISHHHPYHK